MPRDHVIMMIPCSGLPGGSTTRGASYNVTVLVTFKFNFKLVGGSLSHGTRAARTVTPGGHSGA
jgi:hypothetical protein